MFTLNTCFYDQILQYILLIHFKMLSIEGVKLTVR